MRKEFKCSDCGKKFGQKFNQWRHELSHTHGKRRKNNICSKVKSEDFSQDLFTHKNRSFFKGDLCPKRLKSVPS